jgi:chromosome segregation protein
MKIKRLDICGFKSFVDPTVVKFDHDVTVVVGPNGCGKSNIVDSIRWVMGEQSAKTLRGRGMEDVIFAGTETRGPHSFAEVSITFDNSDGVAPPEYSAYPEITVTRRLDRQGNSEYLINKTQVRLMDVTNLFLGTGVGKKAYSIIEQGRIGVIVSAKPQDRRYVIEEAAGITKFKAKKRAAERKMEYTQQNLLRVNDIINEIQRSLASLKRQAQKAERYKKYRAEIRDLDLWVASHRWLELTATHKVLRSLVTEASASAEGARLAMRVREAELEAERLGLQGVESEVVRAQTRAYEVDNAVKLLESQLQHYTEQLRSLVEREHAAHNELSGLDSQREELDAEVSRLSASLDGHQEVERAEADALSRESTEYDRRRHMAAEAETELNQARAVLADADRQIARVDAMRAAAERRRSEARTRLDGIEREREALEAQLVELRQESDELKARVEGLRGGKETIGAQRGELEEELTRLRQDIVTSDEHVEKLRSRLATRRSRLHSLEEIQQRFEGVGAGVRAVMTGFGGRDAERVQGLVADRFECSPDLTQALAAALGERLQYVVVQDVNTGVDAVRYLSAGKHGRATLIPRVPTAVRRPDGEIPAGPGVVGRLMDLVQVRSDDDALARHLLGDVLVVEDLDVARRIHEAGQGDLLLVTRDGQLLASDGRLSGGEGEDAGAHLLEVKREVRELVDEVATLATEMDAASSRHGALRNAIAQRQAAIEAARTDAHETEIGLVKADRDLKRIEETDRQARNRIEKLRQEGADLQRVLDEESDGETREERAAAEAARSEATQRVAAGDEVYRSRRAAVDEQNAVVTEVRVRAAQAKQKVEGDRAVAMRMSRSLEELAARGERLTRDIRQFAEQQGELAGRTSHDREILQQRVDEALKVGEQLASVRAEYDAAREQLASQEAQLRETREGIDADQSSANEMALREREVAMALTHLLEGIADKHRVDVRKELNDYHDRAMPDSGVQGRISELQQVVERMGEINLTAIEEYEERSQRHEYLTSQRDDLEKGLAQLDAAIRQMNRKSRKMFREAFDGVNERFKVMFPRMFGGGRAELRLTDPDDMLESGIDIVAMPPGKKLTSIELMSGGEKALTAVSLIFALFQYKPSPFCLLDEVDAPLDEANVDRYNEMIRSMTDRSQFILITHHKATMMAGDVLYGVTMETPGVSKLVSVEMREADNRKSGGAPSNVSNVAVA